MSGAIVVGVGPGIGLAVARRFVREGMSAGLIARSDATVKAAAAELGNADVLSVTADVTDEPGLRAALDRVVEAYGVPEVVVYNAALIQPDRIGDLSAQQHLDALAVNVVGAITTAAHLAPAMAERGSGSFLITGGMPASKPEYASLSLGKAGVRTVVSLLDQQYGAAGLHAASVTVSGGVAPGSVWDPDEIANHYWRLHTQTPAEWMHEVII
ncbi:SDR family NAD(P)-dependent oxidoreductase [Kribbella shirazensis]|uniref:NAD(P)-dependent dehydrogenase (Short-subunit alcohol dehydrogenase family) n=1 Tax=Kribbella shirazensis TaxID=1105143 RepID=A0A7X5V6C2_9ACTN|nr:SDR family NAD(P)-dependent oxidoreductase [Kribbella shirazensis]NIK55440.1 NAD(P)-dependent dehydrogenase (short-subunit alcohol dehydrogenase family) [Kribbella shirazensis]